MRGPDVLMAAYQCVVNRARTLGHNDVRSPPTRNSVGEVLSICRRRVKSKSLPWQSRGARHRRGS
jgi:hypothetical protein